MQTHTHTHTRTRINNCYFGTPGWQSFPHNDIIVFKTHSFAFKFFTYHFTYIIIIPSYIHWKEMRSAINSAVLILTNRVMSNQSLGYSVSLKGLNQNYNFHKLLQCLIFLSFNWQSCYHDLLVFLTTSVNTTSLTMYIIFNVILLRHFKINFHTISVASNWL